MSTVNPFQVAVLRRPPSRHRYYQYRHVLLLFLWTVSAALLFQPAQSHNYNKYNRRLRNGNATTAENRLGRLNESCGNRRPCQEGLDCILTPSIFLGKVCFPLNCIQQAATNVMREHDLLEQQQSMGNVNNSVATRGHQMDLGAAILARAGISTRDDFFDQHTLNALNNTNMTDVEMSQHINLQSVVKQDVVSKIRQAVEDYAYLIDEYRYQAEHCFVGRQQNENSTQSYYVVFQVEVSLGAKFVYQYGFYEDGIFANICFGAGPDVDLHATGVLGVMCSPDQSQLKDLSFMADVDISPILHLGTALGFTVPGFSLKAEVSGSFLPQGEFKILGLGIGAGAGVYGCIPQL